MIIPTRIHLTRAPPLAATTGARIVRVASNRSCALSVHFPT